MTIKKNVKKMMILTNGSVAVEFAIILPLLIMMVFAIIDFGNMLYTKHIITNASREGARYGVAYRVDSNNNRILPSCQTTEITQIINNYLTDKLPSGTWEIPTLNYDIASKRLTVTVNAKKDWMSPLGLVLTNPFTLSATTVMIAE
ncbi:MAG: TadE/TadG family type IV pilus assembly protein [Desulfobacca sp.]|uniref:TadE/TadG family type IV pilus assembly protein n=1 Tax=Desulfobacca sp. TaxID=2067990 RepID=UPI00404A7D24